MEISALSFCILVYFLDKDLQGHINSLIGMFFKGIGLILKGILWTVLNAIYVVVMVVGFVLLSIKSFSAKVFYI